MKRFKFKTIIINLKWIKAFVLIIGIIIVFFCIEKMFSRGQQIAFSDDFYKTVISKELHNEKKDISLQKIIASLTGIDFENPQTIIKAYSSVFDGDYRLEKPDEPHKSQTPAPTPQTQGKTVEESRIVGEMKISNQTNIDVNANELAIEPLTFSVEKNSSPQILIMHTHTTESFTNSNNNKYIVTDSDRSLDDTKNIVEVGRNMAEVLNAEGIKTIHDTTVHDYPSYNGAYTRSLATVNANLSKENSIKIVLDVHRDGIIRDDGTKVKVVTDINGEKVAQCMFVIGSNANLTHDNWLENMKLACKLQATANEMYPGLMRPIILREERFNQQVSKGAVIVEVGSNGNTLEEAIRGGRYMAEIIAKSLN